MSAPKRFSKITQMPIVAELSELFSEAGHQLFLVGGSVRDIFLGAVHEDLDFTTDALPEDIEKIVKDWADDLWTIGKTYGTIGLSKWGFKAEITTFRAEIYEPQSRHPKVTFSKTIKEDLKRRDFTVNAMALKLPEGTLFDPHNGVKDLQSKILQTPQDPLKSFADDPLRILRAIRFIATLDFKPSNDVVNGIVELKQKLEIISKERIREELSKLLMGLFPASGLRWMIKLELSDFVVPELMDLKMSIDPQFHHKDVLEHTFTVVESVKPDLILRLAALLHDIGKPSTRRIDKGKVHFYGHDVVGARMARKRLRELRYPKNIVEDVVKLIRLHLRPYNYAMGWNDSAVRRYARDAGEMLSRLNQLAVADCTTRIAQKAKRNLELIIDLEKRINYLNEQEEISKIRAPIDGKEIMEYLGLEPGKEVGEALKMLLDARLDDKIKTKEEAYVMLDQWAKHKGLTKK